MFEEDLKLFFLRESVTVFHSPEPALNANVTKIFAIGRGSFVCAKAGRYFVTKETNEIVENVG